MKIPALKVKQWLVPDWDQAQFTGPTRAKPEPHFYVFSISAHLLKRLTGVYRRDPNSSIPPAEDFNIQRRHDKKRSKEILRYIQYGFPLSRIDPKKLADPSEKESLQMPGWLPTAVVVNILSPTDKRGAKEKCVSPSDLVQVAQDPGSPFPWIEIPDGCQKEDWGPAIHPIEVIDGQHRLWALEEPEEGKELWSKEFRERINQVQIPVVAFHGLDVTWQAYLFYTINQLAKKIDTSMVFDLYPLLRTQEWLLRFEGPNIYRETRAQDLTILLWSHPQSPWLNRIMRLGGREKGKVAQAAFLRSLMASFIKRWKTGEGRIGGLFGSPMGSHQHPLNWGREQQAALLIFAWQTLKAAICKSTAAWAEFLLFRNAGNREDLFSGPDTLIATDQGVRGFLCVLNDLLVVDFDVEELELASWGWEAKDDDEDETAITSALNSIPAQMPKVAGRIQLIASALSSFDWRVSSALAPNKDPEYATQASYRGSSGYREIRRQLLLHIQTQAPALSVLVDAVMKTLKFETEEE